ncbi:MAG: cyclic nucleotide-binding domain-containing protein [Nitrospinae bacterium]|nr:cyclic nucleotide-binding domain-containing protein [Nitrospinota bacterium]
MAKKKFFGEYLIEKGIVTEEDVLEALKIQEKKTPNIETVSIKLGYLTVKDIFKVFTEKAGSEENFLDVAVTTKFITPEQAIDITDQRRKMRPQLGEALLMLEKIDKTTLEKELKKYEEITEKFNQVQDALKNLHIFKHIGTESLDSLSYLPQKMRFTDGERVVKQGDAADSFYAVIKGDLKVTANNPDGENEIFITTIAENDVFGEAAIFLDEPRTANITAINDVELLRFERKEFLDFLKKFPKSSLPILVFILRRLLFKLNSTNKELTFERRKFVGQEEVNSLLEDLFD